MRYTLLPRTISCSAARTQFRRASLAPVIRAWSGLLYLISTFVSPLSTLERLWSSTLSQIFPVIYLERASLWLLVLAVTRYLPRAGGLVLEIPVIRAWSGLLYLISTFVSPLSTLERLW